MLESPYFRGYSSICSSQLETASERDNKQTQFGHNAIRVPELDWEGQRW
jgi:hypothetical protein